MVQQRKVFIYTFGCQMNERDSENMVALLAKKSFAQTTDATEADLILINTCSIREHASEKAASQLGRFGKMMEKGKGPKPLIGVTGCVAQQEGTKLLERFPYVDFLIGPDAIQKLPDMVDRLLASRTQELPPPRLVDTSRDLEAPVFVHEFLSYPLRHAEEKATARKVTGFVIITKGCDFRCTFCVVPNTRGPERSASPEEIIAETRALAAQGVREVTFLGQNVNSYGKNFPTPMSFSTLLERVELAIPQDSSLQRFRFTTSHPIDLSVELMEAFVKLPRLCRHLHLPVQCGDNQVLRRMKRLYTIEDYLKKIEHLRALLPSISLTTDIIVGFPGETESQFQRTLALLEEVRYTQIYAFKYSERPNTPAERLKDDVAEQVKSERLERVLKLQHQINRRQNEALVGKILTVLVESKNKKSLTPSFTGRTECNRVVHLSLPENYAEPIGEIVDVMIEVGLKNSLLGKYLPLDSQSKLVPQTVENHV